jgi:hypothetical protein
MARRRRQKKQRPARLKYQVSPGYVTRVISEKVKRRMRKSAVKEALKARTQLPWAIRKLHEAVTTFDPVELVMTISGWAMYVAVGGDHVRDRSFLPDVQQADVEFLLGLMACVPADEWGRGIARPEVIQHVLDALMIARQAFAAVRMNQIGVSRNEEQRAVLALQERMRLHTQIVRNWGYYDSVVGLSLELYSALDGDLLATSGFRCSDVIKIYRSLGELRQEQYSERMNRMRHVMLADTAEAAVHAYYREYPHLDGTPEEFIERMPDDVGPRDVQTMLMAHSDFRMSELAYISVEKTSERTGIAADVVYKVLASTTAVPEAQGDEAIDRIFLDNPVWEFSGLQSDDRFVIPVPQIFFSHVHKVMNRIFKEAELLSLLEERRAEFLEERVEKLFRGAFPSATFFPGHKWTWEKAQYETDLVVVADRVVITVEAKSGALTSQGLRGAPDRLKKHVRDLIGKPAEQSFRFEAVMRAAAAGDRNAVPVTEQLGINASDIDTVIRLSVTLDDFSPIASLEHELKTAGWLDGGVLLAPTMGVADLACVLDVLEKPAVVLHYLRLRYRLQKRVTILGDELDCLGSYIAGGLIVPHGMEHPLLQIVGQSEAVDRYFIGRSAGLDIVKPQRFMPPWFASLLDCLNTQGRPGWSTVALAVLSGLDEQAAADIQARMDDLRVTVPLTREKDNHLCCSVWVPMDEHDDPVIYYVFAEQDFDVRYERAESLAAQILEQTGRLRCVLIGRMIEDWDSPYSFYVIASA